MLAWQAFAPWPTERLHEIGGGRRAYIHDSGAKAPGAAGRSPSPSEVGAQRLARALAALDGFPEQVKQLMATTDPLAVTEHGQFAREADQCTVSAPLDNRVPHCMAMQSADWCGTLLACRPTCGGVWLSREMLHT
jgi:hypothetical protein